MKATDSRRELPIVMTAPSPGLIAKWLKTQTLRVMTPQPVADSHGDWQWASSRARTMVEMGDAVALSPYGQVGDYLWVKEVHSVEALTVYPCPVAWYKADFGPGDEDPRSGEHRYCQSQKTGQPQADCFACAMQGAKFRWRSPLFMSRRMSRFTLEVTNVRCHRLNDLSEQEAVAEGCTCTFTDYGKLHTKGSEPYPGWHYGPSTTSEQCMNSAKMAYANAWNRAHGGPRWNTRPEPNPWNQNPWVWAISFRRVQ
jgi:hypothetical protein